MSSLVKFGDWVLRAGSGVLGFDELLTSAAALEGEGHAFLSSVLYRTWCDGEPTPLHHAALFNYGVVLTNLGRLGLAEKAYGDAIALAPGFLHPRLNLGLLYERQGRFDEAVVQWEWVVEHGGTDANARPLVILALNHLGRMLEARKELGRSMEYLTRSLALDPHQPDVLHHWVYSRQKQSAWPVYQPITGVSVEDMRRATSALAMINVTDDPQVQLEAAREFVQKKMRANLPMLSDRRRYPHKKLKIAYCSSDFCLHPVSMLMVQLLELHNRDDWEVYGFCWSPDDGSALRARILKAFDHYVSIKSVSDEAAAALIRSHEIDILIDLQGQTAGARPDMLSYRPAPLQVTYLGLPATTAHPQIDAVIADRYLIPPDLAKWYTEEVLYMPWVYQPSDRLRTAAQGLSRAAVGLPETGFVFCSFNNSYKYTPDIFAVWMRLLQRTPGSVLWLLADNHWSESNLKQQAQLHGVDVDRLIFAGRVAPEVYLARYQFADLFLDTFPFNAGTTANDCLWMMCPLLTMSGRSFASRMAGALLTAAGLTGLITRSIEEYEAQALELAAAPERCAWYREELRSVRESGRLFDMPQFARDYEALLAGAYARLPEGCVGQVSG